MAYFFIMSGADAGPAVMFVRTNLGIGPMQVLAQRVAQ